MAIKRRITEEMLEVFNMAYLSKTDKTFIDGCMRAQSKNPQLTSKQWYRVVKILNKSIVRALEGTGLELEVEQTNSSKGVKMVEASITKEDGVKRKM